MFLNVWQKSGIHGLKQAFGITDEHLGGVEILLASYAYDEFEGEAFVLFRKHGMLYEVHGSHDSGDGLAGQWEPEDTSIEALRYRLERGDLGRSHHRNAFADPLRALLVRLSRPH